jgi:hypothetical protein
MLFEVFAMLRSGRRSFIFSPWVSPYSYKFACRNVFFVSILHPLLIAGYDVQVPI